MRPRFALLAAAFCASLATFAIPGAFAREYPLFKLNDPQQAIFRYGAVSDQPEKGASTSKVSIVELNTEKYPFARADINVQPSSAARKSYAGIRFIMEGARIPEEDARLILRLRASKSGLPVVVRLTDIDGAEASYDLRRLEGPTTSWKYYEIPFGDFEFQGKSGGKLRPFLKSISILSTQAGQDNIDVALVGFNAP